MWLVLLSVKGGYKVHSVHETKERAVVFQQCKEHDGEDATLCELDKDSATDVWSLANEQKW